MAFWLTNVICHDMSVRMAYWGSRYDAKARQECNLFDRFYSCTYICELCVAQKCAKSGNPDMRYDDFRLDRQRHLTRIDDATYRRTTSTISPYHVIPGWNLGSCLHDILHILYLGTARDLISCLLATWLDHGLLGGPHMSLADKLRQLSLEMHAEFRRQKIHGGMAPHMFVNFGSIPRDSLPLLKT